MVGGGGTEGGRGEDYFYGLFPKRQLWQPKPGLPYPMWDDDWDGRLPASTGDGEEDRRRSRQLRKEGVTRHIILIRHGQYDETPREDSHRVLTALGREQADHTGRRLREMLRGDPENPELGSCRIRVVRVSDMARAKETADIIASHLPGVERAEPDPDLNEGRPAHNIPGGRASPSTIERMDEQHPRIETAFRKYFYRADEPGSMVDEGGDDGGGDTGSEGGPVKHEFEIIICHANVIRYFLCRALQLPPEAWLRLCTYNCSLTYLTIRPTGTVSCRMLGGERVCVCVLPGPVFVVRVRSCCFSKRYNGDSPLRASPCRNSRHLNSLLAWNTTFMSADIGHLPYGATTFSGHPGFNW